MLSARTSLFRVSSTPVSPTNSGASHFAQNKSHAKGQPQTQWIFKNLYKVETHRAFGGFLHFSCGFLAALDLSAVRLYGDEWPITSSASKLESPRASHFAQNKSHAKGQPQTQWIFKNLYKVETHRAFGGFLHFSCSFLAALDLSAVRLYDDEWPITSSASKLESPRVVCLCFFAHRCEKRWQKRNKISLDD